MLQAISILSEHLINPIEEDALSSFRYECLQYILWIMHAYQVWKLIIADCIQFGDWFFYVLLKLYKW